MDTKAHRGYLMIYNHFRGECYISRDGIRIATYQTMEEAKAGIDELVIGQIIDEGRQL